MTGDEFAAAIKATQLIQGMRGICMISPYPDGGAHFTPETLAQFRPEDARAERLSIEGHELTYPWQVSGTACGVRVFTLMDETELRRLFPDLVPTATEEAIAE